MHVREVGRKLKLIGEVTSFANDLERTHVSRGKLLFDMSVLRKDRLSGRQEGLVKKKPEKDKKKSKSMCVQGRSSHIMDHSLVMPPSLPMVLLVRSYVRTVRMPPLGRD